jgi:hypothetical protein
MRQRRCRMEVMGALTKGAFDGCWSHDELLAWAWKGYTKKQREQGSEVTSFGISFLLFKN